MRIKLGLPPSSADAMRKAFPGLAAAEKVMPGVVAMVIGAAAGDAECAHKLEAIMTYSAGSA